MSGNNDISFKIRCGSLIWINILYHWGDWPLIYSFFNLILSVNDKFTDYFMNNRLFFWALHCSNGLNPLLFCKTFNAVDDDLVAAIYKNICGCNCFDLSSSLPFVDISKIALKSSISCADLDVLSRISSKFIDVVVTPDCKYFSNFIPHVNLGDEDFCYHHDTAVVIEQGYHVDTKYGIYLK